jgi:hypothetical protein
MSNVVKFHRDNILNCLYKNAGDKMSKRRKYDEEHRARQMLSG